MEKGVNITAAKYRLFKIDNDWYEVFLGSVRAAIYGKNDILRIIVPHWQENKKIVTELKKLGY